MRIRSKVVSRYEPNRARSLQARLEHSGCLSMLYGWGDQHRLRASIITCLGQCLVVSCGVLAQTSYACAHPESMKWASSEAPEGLGETHALRM